MDLSSLAYAYGAGMLAAFNPCGFVLLPTYVATFLASGSSGSLRTAAAASAQLTAGFLAVFTALGAVVALAGVSVSALGDAASWVGLVSGVFLVLSGTATLFNRKSVGIRLSLGSSRNALTYGINYAAASLACALPVFVGAVVFSFDRGGLATGLLSGVAYAAGMGSVVSSVVALSSLAKDGTVGRLKSSARFFSPLAGVLLIIAGLVLILRRWFNFGFLESLSGDVTDKLDNMAWLPVLITTALAFALFIKRSPTCFSKDTTPDRPTEKINQLTSNKK